jgi:predicted enzyme related to lactoylglutathione lyase
MAPQQQPHRVDFDVYVTVADIRRELAALREAGVTIVRDLTETAYHMLEVEFIDGNGHRVCLGQRITVH